MKALVTNTNKVNVKVQVYCNYVLYMYRYKAESKFFESISVCLFLYKCISKNDYIYL